MNILKEGQIYTLNNGETYDIIHEQWEDGSGSWCYEIVIMKEVFYSNGKVIWGKENIGCSIDYEDIAIDEIREKGVLVGQLGETHIFNPKTRKLEAVNQASN
jgi:hypothetical protein